MDPITNEDIKVAGRVVSISTEGVVADAEQVYDSTARSFQSAINSNVSSSIANINSRIDNINPQIGDHIDLTKTVEDGGESTTYTATLKINDGGGDSSVVGLDASDNPAFYVPSQVLCEDANSLLLIQSTNSKLGLYSLSGDVEINADGQVIVYGTGTQVDGDLSVSGGASVSGDIDLNGDLEIDGNIVGTKLDDLNISNNDDLVIRSIAGNVDIAGDDVTITAGGTAIITGDALITGNLAVNGTISGGTLSANSLSVRDSVFGVISDSQLNSTKSVGVYVVIKYKPAETVGGVVEPEAPEEAYIMTVSKSGNDIIQKIESDSRTFSNNAWSDNWNAYKNSETIAAETNNFGF